MSGFWKRDKPNSSDGVAPVADKAEVTTSKKHAKTHAKKIVLVAGVGLVLLAVGLMVLKQRTETSNNGTKSTNAPKDLTQINQYSDPKSVVEQYESEKQSAAKEVQKTVAKEWDKEMLDKAYFSLIYADKTGSFTEVYAFLSLLDAAKKSGMNIDDNKYGVDQEQRDEMLARANTAAKEAKRKQKVAN